MQTDALRTNLSSLLVERLAQNWWLLLLRGIVAIGFGVLAFAWPGLTLFALVILYGAYALTDGVFALGAAFAHRHPGSPTAWLVFVGILGIAAGLFTFFWPGITALVLLAVIAAYSILHGILEIALAIRLRREIQGEWLLILSGALSVLFGVLILARPGAGALAIVWLIGAYALVFGSLLIAFALRVRTHRPRSHGMQPRHA
jgi:uncharacterized membrane protein HdeD (DUF308 family)